MKFGLSLVLRVAALGLVFALTFSTAHAAVLTNSTGTVLLGVNADGSLIDTSANVGLTLVGLGDALTPGCPCEAWGVQVVSSGSTVNGYTGQSTGNSNIAPDAFTSTSNTANSTTHLASLPDIQVEQDFAESASSSLFQATVTVTNLSSTTTYNDLQYARAMDWDVPPTEFDEVVTLQGWPASALLHSGDNGFAHPFYDGLTIVCPADSNFTACGPADHGAYFIFGFGDLAPGASKSFSIFYGADTTISAAMADLATVHAEVYSLGMSNPARTGLPLGEPGTFIFGFAGVGGSPVNGTPEPATLTLLGAGLAAFGLLRKRLCR